MPQFDIITFFNQLFYFIIVFFCFYFFILGTVVPKISVVLKIRNKKLNKDTSNASLLKNESILIMETYNAVFLKNTSNFINGPAMKSFSLNNMINLRLNFANKNTPLKTGHAYLKSLIKIFTNS
jgi:hypothetical protein